MRRLSVARSSVPGANVRAFMWYGPIGGYRKPGLGLGLLFDWLRKATLAPPPLIRHAPNNEVVNVGEATPQYQPDQALYFHLTLETLCC